MSNSKGMLYEGDVFLRLFSAGVLSDKMIGPIDGTKLQLKANNEILSRTTKRRGQWGKTVGQVSRGKPSTFALGFNSMTPELMAVLFLGEEAAQNITGGTITAESVTLQHDEWVKVSERNITAVVITGSVEGTDYEVNKNVGAIKALSAGNLPDDTATTFDATFSGITGITIKGGTQARVDIEVIMDGMNLEDESDVYIRIPKVTLQIDSDTDLFGDDYIVAEFSGEIERLDTETAEFYVDDSVVYS